MLMVPQCPDPGTETLAHRIATDQLRKDPRHQQLAVPTSNLNHSSQFRQTKTTLLINITIKNCGFQKTRFQLFSPSSTTAHTASSNVNSTNVRSTYSKKRTALWTLSTFRRVGATSFTCLSCSTIWRFVTRKCKCWRNVPAASIKRFKIWVWTTWTSKSAQLAIVCVNS